MRYDNPDSWEHKHYQTMCNRVGFLGLVVFYWLFVTLYSNNFQFVWVTAGKVLVMSFLGGVAVILAVCAFLLIFFEVLSGAWDGFATWIKGY